MNGPDHYREAERLLSDRLTEQLSDPALVAEVVAKAQAHATLALAAATALNYAVGDGMARDERTAWRMVAGTKPALAVKPVEGEAA